MAEPVVVDRRVRKTRRALLDAVLSLAEANDLGAVTVQDITRHADLNRATFYQHYQDRDALFAQTFEVILAELTAECGPVLSGTEVLSPDVVPPSVAAMLRAIRARAPLYRRLLAPGGNSTFIARFQAFQERLMVQALGHIRHGDDGNGGPPPELRARFAAAATTGAISWWLDAEDAPSPEAMAGWLWRLAAPAWFEATWPTTE